MAAAEKSTPKPCQEVLRIIVKKKEKKKKEKPQNNEHLICKLLTALVINISI